jgi:hypothetical protein
MLLNEFGPDQRSYNIYDSLKRNDDGTLTDTELSFVESQLSDPELSEAEKQAYGRAIDDHRTALQKRG